VTTYDAAVVGAGPAGTAAASYLAKGGRTVALLEQKRFPRPKPCGEGIMPAGVEVLAELGVLEAVKAEAAEFRGLRFTGRSGRSAVGLFPGVRGLALRRERLDAILLDAARSLPGVTVLERSRVVAVEPDGDGFLLRARGPEAGFEVRARRLIAADGAASATARLLGTERAMPSRPRYGLRAHFSGARGLEGLVEVRFLDGCEAYVAPMREPGEALVAVLLEEGSRVRPREAFFKAVSRCPQLAAALPISPLMGFGPLGGSADRCAGEGWLLAGDAAASVDPIVGEGIALGLRSGRLAARTLLEGSLERYEDERRMLARAKTVLSRSVLELSRRPILADAALRVLASRPEWFSAILALR
jgi:flavin-dependent dehydrogenase